MITDYSKIGKALRGDSKLTKGKWTKSVEVFRRTKYNQQAQNNFWKIKKSWNLKLKPVQPRKKRRIPVNEIANFVGSVVIT